VSGLDSGACASIIRIAATAHGCVQTGVDHWQNWTATKIFTGAATIEMLDRYAKEKMGPKASWDQLTLSPVEE